MGNPWDGWVPGVLNKNQMNELLVGGYITYSGEAPKLGHSSMDLSLADEAYVMRKGSVKPSQKPYSWFITEKHKLAKKIPKPEGGIYHLKQKKTYVFRLQERLEAALRNEGVIFGQATAKSSVGRVDVLARLIVDGMNTYECFDPRGMEKGSGEMYLEITPITFDVQVKANTSLSQLRLFYGKPEDVTIRAKELFHTVFRDTSHEDDSLTVSLAEAMVGDKNGTSCTGVAFRSKKPAKNRTPVPLWKFAEKPNPLEYWDVEVADGSNRLYIRPDIFYILRSKEKLYVPKGIAIYCRASDETMGEMRIHYAGFVHPYFGLFREDKNRSARSSSPRKSRRRRKDGHPNVLSNV
jgi:dCTP deaminase